MYSELDARRLGGFDVSYVMDILHCHDIDNDLSLKSQLAMRELDEYPYILVMPMGNRDLDEIISKEFDSSDIQTTKLYISKIAKCLAHVHSQGYIHGDLKPKNVMRVNGKLILIDMDGSALLQQGYSGTKVSSAYFPPELIYLDRDTNQYKVKVYSGKTECDLEEDSKDDTCYGLDSYVSSKYESLETNIKDSSNLVKKYDYVLTDPAHDIWSFGVLIYFLCTGQSFFFGDKAENIIDQDSLKSLYDFDIDFKAKRLSVVTDSYAKNLISQLINKDPTKRLSL